MTRQTQNLIGLAATATLLLVGLLSTHDKALVASKMPPFLGMSDVYGIEARATPASPGQRSQQTELLKVHSVASLWPHLAPLTDAEAKQFRLVEGDITHYVEWGTRSLGTTEQFRSLMGQLGPRAAAQYGRSLNSLRNADADQVHAEKALDQIDLLAYLAAAGQPTAYDAIEMLASRPISWDTSGTPKDWTETTVTLEAFNVLAKIAPDRAAEIANQNLPDHRGSYITHYIYGRKLAGRSSRDIKTEVSQTFGNDYVTEQAISTDSLTASAN